MYSERTQDWRNSAMSLQTNYVRYVIIVLAVFIFGCSSGPHPMLKLVDGVDHAEWAFKQLNDNEIVRLQFKDMASMGGDLVTFVTSSAANPATLPAFSMNKPKGPWSIALRQGESFNEFIIEGYGEKTDQPAITKSVKVPRLGKSAR